MNVLKYVRDWMLQPFSQDNGLASHVTHVVCVNFICEWRDLLFNIDSERQIFENIFNGNFILFPEFIPDLRGKKIVKEILFFHISFLMPDLGYKPGFTFNKPTHC